MAALDDLLARIQDVALRADLEREIAPLRGERELGLVFERHLPEKLRLPDLTVRRGVTVEVRDDVDSPMWQVRKVINGVAQLARRDGAGQVLTAERPVNELIVVREFGQPIYPGFRSVGRVERGGDKPFHSIINAENYHALETILYTCAGKIDCIYIDPPYNTGALDWKYNNDYVDGNDLYRHSKWLAFMERRLLVSRRLLRPEGSTLIVTIDEKEYLRLGLLLQQLFPSGRIQMVSTVINRKGNARRGEFARCEEYIFFVRFGEENIQAWRSDMLSESENERTEVRWKSLLRLASTGQTSGRFNLFYPLYFDANTLKFVRAGEPIPDGVDINSVPLPEGMSVLWPISRDGSDGRWSLSLPTFNQYLALGYIKFGRRNGGGRTPSYLMVGQIAAIESGDLIITGQDEDGAVIVESVNEQKQPKTIWNLASHSTSGHGTTMLRDIIPGRRFPYPKSLYAVEDALRFAVGSRPEAIVLDFFAGSGTTAHAVMRLNRQDGGRRQCISVTNNEVAASEQAALSDAGLRPGDPDWEKWGICDYITMPRIASAITGNTPEGNVIEGDYRFTDEFPMSEGFQENVEFFKLTYEDPDQVQLGHAFEAVAPLLWLKAGAQGPRIDELESSWALPVNGRYGVLFDADTWPDFCDAIRESEKATHAFIVTDSEAVFQQVASELPDTVTPVRLYESYLTSFAINTGARS